MPKPEEDSDQSDDDTDNSKHLTFSSKTEISASTDFDSVISDMIVSGYHENNPPENVILEIKGYKFAQNKVSYR
jgi:hypothetical protein